KRALYRRISQTRHLLQAWVEAGEYLSHPERRLSKPTEATDLIYWMGTIRTNLRSFRNLLGEAGQPGYLVVALAGQQVIVPTFQTLLPSQREILARDWQTGRRVLIEYRQQLRHQLRLLRRRSLPSRLLKPVSTTLRSYPGLLCLLLGLLALALA